MRCAFSHGLCVFPVASSATEVLSLSTQAETFLKKLDPIVARLNETRPTAALDRKAVASILFQIRLFEEEVLGKKVRVQNVQSDDPCVACWLNAESFRAGTAAETAPPTSCQVLPRCERRRPSQQDAERAPGVQGAQGAAAAHHLVDEPSGGAGTIRWLIACLRESGCGVAFENSYVSISQGLEALQHVHNTLKVKHGPKACIVTSGVVSRSLFAVTLLICLCPSPPPCTFAVHCQAAGQLKLKIAFGDEVPFADRERLAVRTRAPAPSLVASPPPAVVPSCPVG